MRKGAAFLCVVALLACISAPAIADTGTWVGGDLGSEAVMTDTNNWVGGTVGIDQYGWIGNVWGVAVPGDMVIGSSPASTSMDVNNVGQLSTTGSVTDNYAGTFNFVSSGYGTLEARNQVVVNAGILNLNSLFTVGGANLTCTVAQGAILNVGDTQEPEQPASTVTANGFGTVTAGTAYYSGSFVVNDSVNLICNAAGECPAYTINSLTGNSATASLTTAGLNVASLNFPGQINYTSATSGSNGNPTPLTIGSAGITGTTFNLVGSANNAYVSLVSGATLTNCKITGDGVLDVAGSGALDSYGSTFAPVATNTANGASANGVLTFTGNLVCAKNAAGQNTQLVCAVTGTSGLVGSGYTQLVGNCYSQWYGTFNSTITSFDTFTTGNALDQADLVVNITPGLTPVGINGTNLAGATLYNQALTIITTGNDLTAAGNQFANVKFVGGFATVTMVQTTNPDGSTGSAVELTNIFSNPTLAGDANNDGQVNGADYAVWAANYGANSATWLQGDFNNDGQVNGADYAIWAANYGTGSGTSATPEPISMIILAIGGGLVALKRRNA